MLLTLLLSACQEEELARYNSSISHHDSLDGKKSEEDVNVSCVYSWTCPELLIERRQPSADVFTITSPLIFGSNLPNNLD